MKKSLLIWVLLIIAANAFAAIEGPDSFKASCFSDPVMQEYTITNDFSEKTEFTISLDYTKANFDIKSVPPLPYKVSLEPSQSTSLSLFIKPCCCAEPGDYVLTIKASSSKGEFTKKIRFEVKEAGKLLLSIDPSEMQLSQCEEKNATLSIESTSQASADIILSIKSDSPGLFELSQKELRIEPNGKKTVTLKVKAPCQLTPGKKTAEINAKTIENQCPKLEGKTSATVELVDKQNIEIEKKSFDICNDIEQTKTIKIKNLGPRKDELTLGIDGPQWILLQQKTVSIDAGKEAEISVKFLKSTAEGKFSFTLKAHSVLYNKDSAEQFEVSLKDCYKVTIEKVAGKEKACIEDKSLEYKFEIKNVKNTEITLSLALAGGLKGTLDSDKITLRPEETKALKATIDVSNEKPGKKAFAIKLTSPEFSDAVDVNFNLEDCYALNVDAKAIEREIKLEVSPELCPQSVLLELKATNTGTKEQNVKLSLTGAKWLYLEPTSLKIAPAETKPFYIYVSPAITETAGSYTGTLLVEALDYKKEFPIKINLVSVTLPQKIGIETKAEIEETMVEQEKTVKAKIVLINTSDCMLEVSDVKAEKYNVSFKPTKFTMDKNASVELVATVSLGKLDLNKIEVPIVVTTDRGPIRKTVVIDLVGKKVTEAPIEPTVTATPSETTTPVTPAAPAPQAVAAPITNVIVLLFLAVVAIVIVILAYYAYKKEKAEENTTTKSNGKKGK